MYKMQLKIRKTHRYLGLIIGVQFLAWTVSGLYFSWTDIDQIHGDPFLQLEKPPEAYSNLAGLDQIEEPIHSIDLVPHRNRVVFLGERSIFGQRHHR